ncbi:MAG: hypothetical protein GY717_20100 [Rhodobacteraceae bacterium]|nr:hypothetical protein [Paracoccaceae bacterium]
MNANQLINMVIRLLMRRVVGRGIDAGIDMASRKMGRSSDAPQTERRNDGQDRDMADRAKNTMKATRRISRF